MPEEAAARETADRVLDGQAATPVAIRSPQAIRGDLAVGEFDDTVAARGEYRIVGDDDQRGTGRGAAVEKEVP